VNCSSCGHENPARAKFCLECGGRLTSRCGQCGVELPREAKFCPECGQAVAKPSPDVTVRNPRAYTPKHLADRILAEQAAVEARGIADGERKTITALFADIKGSMELIEDLDPEDARSIIDPALELMIDSVHHYEGHVAQSTGDGIFALFGAPIAHEDHPQRALYAALRMQEEIRRHAERLRAKRGVNLEIRVGINTGEVVVRSIRKDDLHTDYVPIGHSTSLAARLQTLATGGTIVVSEETRKLTEGYFRFKGLGTARIKGVSDLVEIHEVAGVGPLRTKLEVSARRGLSRFTGRQREMGVLRQASELARGGHGQIVAVIGEPGVGKSRLFHEFTTSPQSGSLVLESFSVAHGKASAYLTVIDLLKSYFQITVEDDERRRREKVIGKLLALDRSLEDILPYLFSLLGITDPDSALQQMDSEIRRRRTLESLKRLLLRESLNQPLIVVFEDLHWLDGESQAFLDLLTESIGGARILLLVNYRPEYRHEWSNKSCYAQLRLDALSRESATEMLAALLGEGSDLDPLKRLVIEKTDGNPFFMEEVIQALFDQGFLVRDNAVRLSRSLAELQVPTTVQGVLASRIDRLGAEEKELLQILSVMGKVSSLSLVREVTGRSENRLERWLATLQAGEFLYEQPGIPDTEYVFKHALTHDVAYLSLLLERRRMLHERAARAIETLASGRLDEHYTELARHYSHSGNCKKAVDYLRLAGEQAAQRSAHSDAIRHLSAAVDLLHRLPSGAERTRQELALQIALGSSFMASKGYGAPELEKACRRARELCEETGDIPRLSSVLYGLWAIHEVRAEFGPARELGEQIHGLAERTGDVELFARAHRALGDTLFFLGDQPRALEHCDKGIALHPRLQQSHFFGEHPSICCFAGAGLVLCLRGYPEQAVRRANEAVAFAQAGGHQFTLARALGCSAMVHFFRRDPEACQRHAEATVELCTNRGFPFWLTVGTCDRGWALAAQQRRAEGIDEIRQALTAWKSMGLEVCLPYYLSMLAETLGRSGEPSNGLEILTEAFALVEENEERFYEAELHRLNGELLLDLSSDNATGAKAYFQHAIYVARRQSAKLLELRATTSLARLLDKEGRKDEARRMLGDIYGWFTEGFDTADLKDARALLDTLS
jgi:class 3 adenylate cyclase/predicted ATPase